MGYRLVDVKDANGNLVITHKNTIEKAVEIDPEAADWTRRGAEMIACEGKSAIDVARLFNEHKVGGKQTWTDSRVRQHYGREKLVGKDVLHKTKQVVDLHTGKKKFVRLLCSAAGPTRDGERPSAARPRLGAVCFLHRFGSALNHHVHLHACTTDGVFIPIGDGPPAFLLARPITQAAHRLGRARPGPLSAATSFKRRPTSCP